MTKLADRLFDGFFAEGEIEDFLDIERVPYDHIGWDHYDCSLELHDVDNDWRMSEKIQRFMFEAGFATVYVNHKDKWETHYGWSKNKEFEISKGWRVSYPHKRGDNEKGIWVEEHIPSWPANWFETGYVIIKEK